MKMSIPNRPDSSFFLAIVLCGFLLLLYLHAQSQWTPAVTVEPSDFDANLVAFNHEWNKFFRPHFGCPTDAHKLNECVPAKAKTLDYVEWKKVIAEWDKRFGDEQRELMRKAGR